MPTDDQIRLAQHLRRMEGWVTAGYFDAAPEEIPARDELLAAGRIEAGKFDRINVYRLTDTGLAWLAENEQQ